MCEIPPRLPQGSLIKSNDERNKGRDTSMIMRSRPYLLLHLIDLNLQSAQSPFLWSQTSL